MNKIIFGALCVLSLAAGLSACDSRSNKDLNGVATWPMGGPAHGAWVDPAPMTYSETTRTTTTTTTVQPVAPAYR
jgi:hypothetical protein